MNPDILAPAPELAVAHLELTTRCNLRCIYCHRSFSESGLSRGEDFPSQLIPGLVEGLRRCGLKHLRVSGDGETTVHPNWRLTCEQFLSAGFDLEMVSNLAKQFSPDELGTLAKFNRILVSLDTTDPDILRNLRRGVSVERILHNVTAIVNESRKLGIPMPQLCLSVVVSDKIVFGLEKTIQDALGLGFQDFFLNDLVPGPDIPGELNIKPIWAMPREELVEAQKCLESALRIAANAGAIVVGTPGLLSTIKDVLDGGHPGEPVIGRWACTPPGSTQTRCCLSLWRHTYMTVDGSVRPCCLPTTPVMGNLGEKSIQEILNDAPYRNFRAKLLSGDLADACVNCALAGVVSTDYLRSRVVAIVRRLSEIIESFLPIWRGKRIVIYGAGGHSRKLFAETAINSIPLLGIVDRNPKLHGKSLGGLPIYPIEAIDNLKPQTIVISSLELEDEIYQQLDSARRRGIETVRLYHNGQW